MPDLLLDTSRLRQYAQRIERTNTRIDRLNARLIELYLRSASPELLRLLYSDVIPYGNWQLSCCKKFLNETASEFDYNETYLKQFDPANFKLPTALEVWLSFIKSGQGIWGSYLKNIQKAFRKKSGLGLLLAGIGTAQSALWSMSSAALNALFDLDYSATAHGSVWSSKSEEKGAACSALTGTASASAKSTYGEYKNGKVFQPDKQDKLDVPWKKDTLPDESFYEQTGTVLEERVEAKLTGSVFESTLAGSNDWAEGSLTASLLTGEVYATAGAGLYVYEKDKDGNVVRIFSPGVSAEVGASVAVAQIEVDGRIGLGEDKKMLGLYGNYEEEVLSAEAKAGISANINELYAGAKAEANLIKATATAGVSVLGTDIGVTASAKIGVGVHAEIGYTDGKLKVDVGAALGVGFDLGFEIDISGTVKAVSDFAQSAVNTVKDVATTAVNAVCDVAQSVGNAVGSAINTVGNAISNAGKAVAKSKVWPWNWW